MIQYIKGKENIVVDTLSRGEEGGECWVVSALVLDWVKEVLDSYEQTPWAKDLMTQLVARPTEYKGYSLKARLLQVTCSIC